MATFPFEAPTVSEGAFTVDLMLNQPQRISRYIADLTQESFLTPKLFSTTGATGGAIMFDVARKNDLYVDGGVGIVAPGGEFPVVSSSVADPEIRKVKKTGGKFKVTREARRRNDMSVIEREARKLANTIVQDTDATGVEAIYSALTKYDSDVVKVQSGGWAAAGKVKAADRVPAASIRADFIKAKAEGKKLKLGYSYDTLLVHPDDEANFQLAFEDDTKSAALLGAQGITLESSDAVKSGTALLVSGGTLGVMGVEDPLTTEVWEDKSIQSDWTQSFTSVAFGITDPLAIIQITGIGS